MSPPLVDIIDREGSHYNILLCASQFAEKEIERVKNLTKASLIESMKIITHYGVSLNANKTDSR